MNTMTKILFAALMSAQSVQAGTAFSDLQSSPFISSKDFSYSEASLPEATPIPADLRDSVSATRGDSEIDTEKAELMAKLALKHGPDFGGQCYNAVWFDVLLKAGFPNDGDVPGTSAYQFAEYAKNNPAWLKAYGMKIIPTPDTLEELPVGSVVVYDPKQEDPYGRAHSAHGHIEVIADRDGARFGCSDACADITGTGAFLAKPEAKEHVTVFMPIK
jgi:hypothetical protein